MGTPQDNQDMTDSQQQRLKQRRSSLQEQWNLINERLSYLRQAYAIEAVTETKFQLKKQIEASDKERVELENELVGIEDNLKQILHEKPPECDRDYLLKSLSLCPDAVLNKTIFLIHAPRDVLPPKTVEQATRAIALIEWAENENNVGIKVLCDKYFQASSNRRL